jgi:hypothetical protein
VALIDLSDWLDERTGSQYIWYVKRLSGNDTLANKTHQAGPYIPRDFLFDIFPHLNAPEKDNPDIWFNLYIDSHADHKQVRAVWYNNKLRGGTRNETRLTGFGGMNSALLDPESTGALTVFAFSLNPQGVAQDCHVWVCNHEVEEDIIEDRIGPVDPGKWLIWPPAYSRQPSLFCPDTAPKNCRLLPHEIPAHWLQKFPSGAEITLKAVQLRPLRGDNCDLRLIKRRDCEFEIFRSVEEAIELPFIQRGFHDIDSFIARAQTILQRRKARSGRSLELHTREVFIEEKLLENQDFSHQPESDPGKKPDFLFPSQAAYKDNNFPAERLRMLAVKTTCKDRWRQILNEAARIPVKHLLTLQEGVSVGQFNEMSEAGVKLIVPAPLIKSYSVDIQPHLQTLESFIGDIRILKV